MYVKKKVILSNCLHFKYSNYFKVTLFQHLSAALHNMTCDQADVFQCYMFIYACVK